MTLNNNKPRPTELTIFDFVNYTPQSNDVNDSKVKQHQKTPMNLNKTGDLQHVNPASDQLTIKYKKEKAKPIVNKVTHLKKIILEEREKQWKDSNNNIDFQLTEKELELLNNSNLTEQRKRILILKKSSKTES